MKKQSIIAIVLIVLFEVFAFPSQAQKIHFSDTSNRWMTYFYQSQGASNGFEVRRRFSYLDSMTEENGYLYAILKNDNDGQILVREEGNKVFIRPLANTFNNLLVTDTSEFLYFDYNFQIGDTFQMPLVSPNNSGSFSSHAVTEIDSIIIENIVYKKFLVSVVSGYFGGYVFIEGLGTYNGPMAAPFEWHYQGSLICFENKGRTPAAQFSNCSQLTSIKDAGITDDALQLIPNPATGTILIKCIGQKEKSLQLDVIDMLGRNVMHARLEKEKVIDISDFLPGIFLCKISDGEKVAITKKLIVRR